ncbi:hypothetical protein M409DRAFT_63446 [Zasmidium cellare ATCC 36951]|uniref:non-specific serine/threonine protein kinase n=1 Tax=Zasmidium cellare ATCC 36951 TaxID=1080233 RepID=A0A6A6CXY3_ZASCE|nr:uncharacterized protein M409DRAFT_63446 [Zasmidium cellare ATCC 36951]KAF2171905.1 hypothetical protein M409DRAFT_63446 [Zasmidium cellare ATCC 36951]
MISSSIMRSLTLIGRKWKPLIFPQKPFAQIASSERIEEETFRDYVASRYYPTHIGEVLRDRYQVVGKLGYGASSTVWLARDLSGKRHVVLKLFITSSSLGKHLDDEINIYRRLKKQTQVHPGRDAVRQLLDTFDIEGPDGQHRCLVHPPLWESALSFLHRNPIGRLPVPVLAFTLRRLFQALDFLHSECRVIHTDIKADNIMFGIQDYDVFRKYEQLELQEPSPRKVLDDRTSYTSRDLSPPKQWGAPVLCDFGSAALGDAEHTEDIQPDIYRAPEVILGIPWSYEVDIWNTGCMVWDLFEGGHLFTGHDPEVHRYRSRSHLAEMIALLGSPPLELLAQGAVSDHFFAKDGTLHADIPRPDAVSLEHREDSLIGSEDRQLFLRFMSKMLQWEPSKRHSAKALAEDEWIRKNT